MKKIVTNFIATKGGTYQTQEDLKNLIIKEFNLPDDWNKYIKYYHDYDKITFYKGLNTNWDNRIASFKLDGKVFEYSPIQRMKIIDTYMQQKNKIELELKQIEKRKKVQSVFKHLEKKYLFENRTYEIKLSLYSISMKYQMLIQMIDADINDKFRKLISGLRKPVLVLDINYNFDNDTIVYNLNPVRFDMSGSIESIKEELELAKDFNNCIMQFYNGIELPISIVNELA